MWFILIYFSHLKIHILQLYGVLFCKYQLDSGVLVAFFKSFVSTVFFFVCLFVFCLVISVAERDVKTSNYDCGINLFLP